jgi:hypothetical protein
MHIVPSGLQVAPVAQFPQDTTLPQLSVAEPHTLPVQAWPFGTHWQVPGPPLAPLHVLPPVQAGPHVIVPPQPSAIEPHVLVPQACAVVNGTHLQTLGVVFGHTSGEVQVPQLTAVPQLFVVEPQLF